MHPRSRGIAVAAALAGAVLCLPWPAAAATSPTARRAGSARSIELDAGALKEITFRPIGPANMGGRITDFAVEESNPSHFYMATASGGLFRTTNSGTTWSPLFDKQPVSSIGAVAVWQKNARVVWAGTGEANNRNSSSWGEGVFRSNDAGASWTPCGLEATRHISRVVTDPADSLVVYVAAMGRLWAENPERGVFKTTDGGRTWSHVLKVDARTGACDLAMDPSDPRVLYAAMYARKRTPWSYEDGGRTGGIYRTSDAGRTWTKLGGGLPAETGRIGLDVYRRQPGIVVAVVGSSEGGYLAEIEDRSRVGGVFRSEDGGRTWTRTADHAPRPFYFSQIRIDPRDSSRVYVLGFDLFVSDDGGRTFRARGARNLHPDLHAMWIDPNRPERCLVGTDGGVYLSHDRTQNWDYLDNLALGQFYNVTTDMRRPYRVFGGLQDNQVWMGPSRSALDPDSWLDDDRNNGITNASWECLGGGDGFHVQVDPGNPDLVYLESQGAHVTRLNLSSGRRFNLRPSNREGEPRFRFNWNSPFQISPHDSSVIWLGGNRLFRLYQRGERWELASPDLTTRDPDRMLTGGSTAEAHCTITTIAESPIAKGVLWVGTDDGKVWLGRDAGATWTDLTPNLRGKVPAGLYVSRVEASHHDAATVYVAFDGHRTGNENPHVVRSTDHGRSWASIVSNLPEGGPVKVIREDLVNPELLWAGTEFGLWMSLDGGRHWMKPGTSLPTVPVDDVHVHPRDGDLVVGTHGRSVWILDDLTALRGATRASLDSAVALFTPRTAEAFLYRPQSGLWGQRAFTANNPPFGAGLWYHVKTWTGDGVTLTIVDAAGKTVRKLTGSGAPGFHRVLWDLQGGEPRERIDRDDLFGPEFVKAGRYTVKLKYGDTREQKAEFDVAVAPGLEAPAP